MILVWATSLGCLRYLTAKDFTRFEKHYHGVNVNMIADCFLVLKRKVENENPEDVRIKGIL